jgi:hypothetical protein
MKSEPLPSPSISSLLPPVHAAYESGSILLPIRHGTSMEAW